MTDFIELTKWNGKAVESVYVDVSKVTHVSHIIESISIKDANHNTIVHLISGKTVTVVEDIDTVMKAITFRKKGAWLY